MFPPFNRRDSGRYALAGAALLAALAADVASQFGWNGDGIGLAALAAGCGTILLFAALTWRLPADVRLCRLDGSARLSALEPPAPDTARLRIALRREKLAFYRMDLFIDRVRVGQLRPGAALVIMLPPGCHVLSACVWLRRLDLQEQINALPGTDSDFMVESSGSKRRQFGIERRDISARLRDGQTMLIGPPVGAGQGSAGSPP